MERCQDFGEGSVGLRLRQMDLDEARLVGERGIVAGPAHRVSTWRVMEWIVNRDRDVGCEKKTAFGAYLP